MSVKDIMALKYISLPAAIVIAGFLALNIVLGFVLYHFTSLDAITALLCSVRAA